VVLFFVVGIRIVGLGLVVVVDRGFGWVPYFLGHDLLNAAPDGGLYRSKEVQGIQGLEG
jgi:hypothetical protein